MFSDETKQVIMTLFRNLTKEKNKGSLLFSMDDPIKRASGLTGITLSTIKRWIKEDGSSPVKKPRALQLKRGSKPLLDDFSRKLVATEIQKMFASREVVILPRLKKILETNYDITVSKSTLWRSLKAEGFAFRKTGGNRRILCERGDLRRARAKFLRKIREARDQGLNLVFLDETWVNAHHTFLKEWMS